MESEGTESAEVLYQDSHVAVVEVKLKETSFHDDKCKLWSSNLLKQLADLASTSTLCDLSINNGQHSYKIHSIVLTAQSQKYAQFFLESEKASAPMDITLTGIFQQEVLEEVLQYLYTGEIQFSDLTIEETLNAVMQLDLLRLKDECMTYMLNYNLGNVLSYTNIAFKYQFDDLCQDTAKYSRKYASMLITTPEFMQISVDVLNNILDCQVGDDKQEVTMLEAVIKWVSADSEKRKILFPKLLEKVNLTKLAPHQIDANMKSHEVLFNLEECTDVLLNAFKFHAISPSSNREKKPDLKQSRKVRF